MAVAFHLPCLEVGGGGGLTVGVGPLPCRWLVKLLRSSGLKNALIRKYVPSTHRHLPLLLLNIPIRSTSQGPVLSTGHGLPTRCTILVCRTAFPFGW